MVRALTRRDILLLLATGAWAIIGYWRYRQTLSANTADEYLRDAWQHLKYSDIAFLYFRDNLANHPIPYVQYQLEYPVLLGAFSYVFSLSGNLAWYFSLTYAALAVSALLAVYLLDRLPDVDAAYLALAPGLVLYIGLNWDLAAICLCAIGLRLTLVNPMLAAAVLTCAVWFKFFPIVLVAAMVIDFLRNRQLREVAITIATFAAVTAIINGPLAVAYFERWSRFFRLNRDRGADSSLWLLNRGMDAAQVNLIMTVTLVAGGLVLIKACWQSPHSIVLPLGALLVMWWMVVNKTFQPQYATWVYLACTVLRPKWALWVALIVVDLASYTVSFLYQFEIHQDETFGNPRSRSIEVWTYDNLYVPIQVIRAGLLIALIVWGIWRVRNPDARFRPEGVLSRSPCTVDGVQSA